MLAVGAGDTVDGAPCPDPVRHDESRDAAQPRVPIRCVGGVQLVAVADPHELVAVLHLQEELKIEVAGDPEQVRDTRLPQAPQQEVADSHCRVCDCVHPQARLKPASRLQQATLHMLAGAPHMAHPAS